MTTHIPSTEHLQKEIFAREFLKIAKQDLIAAKVLHRNELYPQALFFLQQSVEKGYKAYHLLSEQGVDNGKISRKDMTIWDIGHVPTKITEKQASDAAERFLKIKNQIDSFPNPEEIYANIGIDFSEMIQQFSTLKNTFAEISSSQRTTKKIRRCVLNNIINEMYISIKKSDRITREFRNITFDDMTKDKMKKKSLDLFLPIIKNSPEHAKKYTDMINDLFGENFQQIEPYIRISMQNRFESGCVNVIYSNLSIITQAHESSTRYPGFSCSPLKEYTRRHPIIQRFNTLTRFAETAHNKFNWILSSMENLQ